METVKRCKNLLINEPILQYSDFEKSFNLTTDALNFAIGAILFQGEVGRDLPVAYASRTLNSAEQNYSTIEKELLAIVWATEYFRPYQYGRKFTIFTDHQPLQWLSNLKNPNSKLARWRIRLEEYNIKYKKGAQNTNADALSRNYETRVANTETNKILDKFLEEEIKHMENLENFEPSDDFDEILFDSIEADSSMATCGEEEHDNTQTVHSDQKNPIISILNIETPVYHGQNQIIISKVYNNPVQSKI